MRATVDGPNPRPCFCKTLHDVIIDSMSLFSADLARGDPALVRHDEENEIGKPAQSRKCLRVEINLCNVSKESRIFDECTVAVKKYCWFLHSRYHHLAGGTRSTWRLR